MRKVQVVDEPGYIRNIGVATANAKRSAAGVNIGFIGAAHLFAMKIEKTNNSGNIGYVRVLRLGAVGVSRKADATVHIDEDEGGQG